MRQIEAFVVLAEARSFSEAAHRFGLSQPAFSAVIQRMESAMGLRLFHRTSRSVELSAEGHAFLPRAQDLLRSWSSVFDDMADLAAARGGRVTVAALPSLAAGLLSNLAITFRRSHPGVRLDLRDVLHEDVVALVKSGQADFGISVAPPDQPEIEFVPLLQDTFVAIVSREHVLATRGTLTWAMLRDQPLVAMTRATSVRRLMDDAFRKTGLSPMPVCEVNHLATIAGLVASGFGISALPALCLPTVLRPEIAWLPLATPTAWRTLGVLKLRRAPSIAAAAFLSELHHQNPRAVFSEFDAHIRFNPPPAA
ncbi:LysR family transcriptional regulator [Palleronia aestuarii]|nr:LysR family transcriptional regulator [Palleronia aestuarii]